MTALAFLAIPVVISVAYGLWLWFRGRQPNSLQSGIDAFQREMHALSPEDQEEPRPRRPRPPRPPVGD